MKLTIFKNKNGEVHGWCTGTASYTTVIKPKGEKPYKAESQEQELNEDETNKIQSNTHKPDLQNGVIKIIKR